VAYQQGEYDQAVAMFEEALALQRQLGDPWGATVSLNGLGHVAHAQGDVTRAASIFEESLALSRRIGNTAFIAMSLHGLGRVAHARGDGREATSLQQEGIQLSRGIGDAGLVVTGLEDFSWLTTACGDYQRAALLGGAAEAMREDLGMLLPGDQRAGHAEAVGAMRAALGEADFAAAWAEGRALPMDEAVALALEQTAATG
jgi:tetratricopeptide (TPR) repeat protein